MRDSHIADVAARNVLPADSRLLEQRPAALLQRCPGAGREGGSGDEGDGGREFGGEGMRGGESRAGQSWPGRLFVFVDWVLFVPHDAAEPDIKMHIPSLRHVRRRGQELVLTPLSKLAPYAGAASSGAAEVWEAREMPLRGVGQEGSGEPRVSWPQTAP